MFIFAGHGRGHRAGRAKAEPGLETIGERGLSRGGKVTLKAGVLAVFYIYQNN